MTARPIPFAASSDVAALLHAGLDRYERRPVESGGITRGVRPVRAGLEEVELLGYDSQADPEPRLIANQQLQALERLGLVRLEWLPGETGHLLKAVWIPIEATGALFDWLGRTPESSIRASLERLLLGERFRFPDGWRRLAVHQTLERLKAGKSPTPFNLADPAFNEDLLSALAALGEASEETPYRVFSVRNFNDSKRFEALKPALVRLAQRAVPAWRSYSAEETLRELGLVPNPGYLYLSGPWELWDGEGRGLQLDGFWPAVGLPAGQAGGLQRVQVQADAVMCIENATSFYEFVRRRPEVATICLWGNPSPACRHLLRRLAAELPDDIPLLLWADLDYGGFNILAQLRSAVSPRFTPYRMDLATLEAHAAFARPLTPGDLRNLKRLAAKPVLADQRPLLAALVERGLKLEQEAVQP